MKMCIRMRRTIVNIVVWGGFIVASCILNKISDHKTDDPKMTLLSTVI